MRPRPKEIQKQFNALANLSGLFFAVLSDFVNLLQIIKIIELFYDGYLKYTV